MYGVCISMESMRRTYIGGSFLSLFIIKSYGLDRQAAPTLKYLKAAIDTLEGQIARLKSPLGFLTQPFIDYAGSAVVSMHIIEILKEIQRPPGCELYWGKGD